MNELQVREGTNLVTTQGDQLRYMDRTLKKEEDLLHANKRVRNAASLTGALKNAFLPSSIASSSSSNPSAGGGLTFAPVGNIEEVHLSAAEQGDTTAELSAVMGQVT